MKGHHEVEMRDDINDSNNADGKEDSDEGRDDGVGVVGVKMGEDCDDGDRVDEVRDEEMQRDEAQEDDEGRDTKEVQEEGGDVVKDDGQDGVGLSLESLKPKVIEIKQPKDQRSRNMVKYKARPGSRGSPATRETPMPGWSGTRLAKQNLIHLRSKPPPGQAWTPPPSSPPCPGGRHTSTGAGSAPSCQEGGRENELQAVGEGLHQMGADAHWQSSQAADTVG